jgi:curli biogenesis system outer membrane secretion channel CsgG
MGIPFAGPAGRYLPSVLSLLAVILMLAGCATEGFQTLTPRTVATYRTDYSGPKYTLTVGRFQNRSNYLRGVFSDGKDRLGGQARTILKTHLRQTNRFVLVDRDNMHLIAQEAEIRDEQPALQGAQVLITGAVTEFGRRETGDVQLWGILGKGKKQVAYANVAINVVDVATSEIVHAAQGAGEYNLSNREIIGFGSTAGYDATLNGKVLNLAITEAVNRLAASMENGEWSPNKRHR